MKLRLWKYAMELSTMKKSFEGRFLTKLIPNRYQMFFLFQSISSNFLLETLVLGESYLWQHKTLSHPKTTPNYLDKDYHFQWISNWFLFVDSFDQSKYRLRSRHQFKTSPKSVEQSGSIDNYNRFQIYSRIKFAIKYWTSITIRRATGSCTR